MSLLPTATYSAPGVPLYGTGGGGGSSTLPSTLTVGPNSSGTSLITIFGDANERLKIVSTGPDSVIQHADSNGVNDTPYIGFGGSDGTFKIVDPANNIMMSLSSVTFGVDMNTGIRMNNNYLFLDPITQSGLYYQPIDSNVYLTGQSTHQVNIGVQGNPTALQVKDSNVVDIPGNLVVSSINGASFPSAGTLSTLGLSAANFPGGNGVVPISGVPFAMTDSFVVDTTHKYRVSLEAGYTNSDPTSYTSIYVGGTTPTVYLTTINNAMAVPGFNDARAGCSAIFAPTLSNVQMIAINSSASATTGVQVNIASGVVLEDLGVVA